jgi:hypothetical protein
MLVGSWPLDVVLLGARSSPPSVAPYRLPSARPGTELRLGKWRADPPTKEAEIVRVEERIGVGVTKSGLGILGWVM